MNRSLLSRAAAAAAFVVCAAGTVMASTGATGAGGTPGVADAFGLSGGRLTNVQLRPGASQDQVLVDVDLGDGPTTLELTRYSVRSPGFAVVASGAAGEVKMKPPAVATYRGFDRATNARVAATVIGGTVSAAITLDGREPRYIQPLSDAVAGADAAQHVVYNASEVKPGDWRCADDEATVAPGATFTQRGVPPTGNDAACLRTVEIIFDTDYPFYTAHQSSAMATTTDIETVLNQIDAIYRRDVGVTFQIKQINVRTVQATDPYLDLATANVDPNTILTRVGTVWGGVPTPTRDLVHLMTGRDLNSTVIGIAWIGVVCNPSYNTGVSQSLFTPNLAMRTVVTAHEIGHNFGANHDASGNFIMAPATSPSSVQQFSPGSITVIGSYISASGSCLATSTPTAVADAAATQAPVTVLIDVLANDGAGCGATTLTLPSATGSAGGGVIISVGTGPGGRNQVRYAPPATVPSAGLNDTFSYRIQDSVTGALSTGTVTVAVAGAAGGACAGDFNGSGVISVQDIFDFLTAYFGNDPRADVNRAGGISVQDIFDYLAAYFRGCP